MTGASSGVPVPGGICRSASFSRSDTCWRAQYTSVSSENTMVTTERPKRENERTSCTSGMVAMACSMGNVTSRSTSGAPSEGVWVMTCTWLLVMSGTASMGRCASE